MSCIVTARVNAAMVRTYYHKLAIAVFGKHRGGHEMERIDNLAVADLFYRLLQKMGVSIERIKAVGQPEKSESRRWAKCGC